MNNLEKEVVLSHSQPGNFPGFRLLSTSLKFIPEISPLYLQQQCERQRTGTSVHRHNRIHETSSTGETPDKLNNNSTLKKGNNILQDMFQHS